jgi:hypothetical protein
MQEHENRCDPEQPTAPVTEGEIKGFERRCDTKQAAGFLSQYGYRTAPATLNKLRCIGGGPEFELFGRRPIYRPTKLLDWARLRTTGPVRSTSDHSATYAAPRTAVSKASAPEAHPRRRGRPRKPVQADDTVATADPAVAS